MENEHEMSYEALTRVYLGSYEIIRVSYKANFTLGAQGDLETRLGHMYQLEDDVGRLWGEYYILELARNDVEESLWPRVIMVQKKEMWPKLPGPEVTKSCWLEKTYMKIRNDIGRLRDCATLVMQRFYLGIFEIFAIASPPLTEISSRDLVGCWRDVKERFMILGASFTQGTISSISIGGSISSEGFLSFILLSVVIIVMVVIVIVILIVVVDDVSLFLKLSFVIIGVPVGSGFPLLFCVLLGLLALAIVVACAFRAEEMPLVISCWMAAKVMVGVSDVDVLLGGILST
ncbi:hypothetical protein Tco_0317652 [Tanacetum coccineum]